MHYDFGEERRCTMQRTIDLAEDQFRSSNAWRWRSA